MIRTPVHKYLDNYAEKEARDLLTMHLPRQWDVAVVLPCYGEADLITGCFDSLISSAKEYDQRLLIILVVNSKTSDSVLRKSENQRVLELLQKQEQVTDRLAWTKYLQQDILLIDCNSSGLEFPDDQGVGLARKIGCDCALSLWSRQAVKQPWIHTTDGDVRVALDYLAPRQAPANVVSINVSFKHAPIDPLSLSWKALSAYELSLHYYVRGLQYADSPYAFHTIGSTIVVKADAYAKVRGFPKRMAGEDFYILNKLAKIGVISSCDREPITILDRPSDRVPFGTGAAVTKISKTLIENDPYTFYHPKNFDYLKKWWRCIRTHTIDQPALNVWEKFTTASGLEAQVLEELFIQLQIKKGLTVATQQAKTELEFTEAMRIWFDALKHLRFIHLLRDYHQPNLPHETAISQAVWWR